MALPSRICWKVADHHLNSMTETILQDLASKTWIHACNDEIDQKLN